MHCIGWLGVALEWADRCGNVENLIGTERFCHDTRQRHMRTMWWIK